MKRVAEDFVMKWLVAPERKPLVIRGARQVGKTWLVRHVAQKARKTLIEINLEKQPRLREAFVENDPAVVIKRLSVMLEMSIEPDSSLLFIDEIQEEPELFAKLRWFAEDMPELPVIAAGSFLEFVLGRYQMSMPVGHIHYMYLEPFSFEEFLTALQRPQLLDAVQQFTWDDGIDTLSHSRLLSLVRDYLFVGGMPLAVKSWVTHESLEQVQHVHADLLGTYRDDFAQYSQKVPKELMRGVVRKTAHRLGKKFVYRSVDEQASLYTIKQALDLLCQARVCHKVHATAAHGLPLAAEMREKFFKVIMLDCGLVSSELNLSLEDLHKDDPLELRNSGGMAEQLVGQLLRTLSPIYKEPEVYYWVASDGGSAEVDYVIQRGTKVVPIEVKAGTTGTLKSLHRFMALHGGSKAGSTAVRISSLEPSISQVQVHDTQGLPAEYTLYSLPFYLVGQLRRLVL